MLSCKYLNNYLTKIIFFTIFSNEIFLRTPFFFFLTKLDAMSENLSKLSGRKGLGNNLFERIGELSEINGTPDPEAMKSLAKEFLMGSSQLYGTASFYDFTRPENKDKKAYVCNGTACQLAGTQEALREELEKHLKPEEIGEMCCLGRCHENGAFHFDGANYSAQNAAALQSIFEGKKSEHQDEYGVGAIGQAILTGPPMEIPAFKEAMRKMLSTPPEQLLQEIHTSKLRGRGGAGFPIGIKMEGCRKAKGQPKFVVCNADEGDPGSFSDRYLLEKRPLEVLLGMAMAAYVVGAKTGVLYIRAEYPESIQIIEESIHKLRKEGVICNGNLNFDMDFKIIKARGAYICGEETALLSSIEGQRPEVRIRPPYPVEEGLFGLPTLVNNVETLASLVYVLEHGGEAYAQLGTTSSSGTKLVSLDWTFNNPGVYEVPMGTPLTALINNLGGGFSTDVKALHIGGPLGGLVPKEKFGDLSIDFESFSQQGFLLGHASIVGVPESYPMIAYLEHLFEFLTHESCGKCFPCRLGSVRGMELFRKARQEEHLLDKELVEDLLDTLEQGSLCALGGGLPLPIRNALQYFMEELRPYFTPDSISVSPLKSSIQ